MYITSFYKQAILVLLFGFISFGIVAQDTGNNKQIYFVRSMFDLKNVDQINILENYLRNNTLVKSFRFETNSKTFLLITNSTEDFTNDVLKAILGEFYNKFSCVQIGVYGVDKMEKYPITNY